MRWLFVVAILASCTKKDSSQGLPAAENWNAEQATGVDPKPVNPKTANPHAGGGTSFHGSTDPNGSADPDDPHAGIGANPSNPHAGMDPSNPHGGMDPSDQSATIGMGDNPHAGTGAGAGPMVEKTAPRSLEKLPDGRYALGPFSVALPDGWTMKPVTSSMRSADLSFGGDSEMIVYYFGTGGAGSVDDNLDRWLGHLVQPDGKSSRDAAKIDKLKVNGQDATIMTVAGHYQDGGMMGSAPVDIAEGGMLAAIVPSPEGPYYFKGFGSKKTLDANAAKFRAMLTAIKLR